ncbi:hypothetical protein [Maridesulfovibrio ferrireducens]|uniref:hypothetical protein n=1 Tax=Maridesulfovibrio ferrireducens TaxID=246191 RepID=UPI001A198678|nr:hypothetical protein [Maridesulfovibrio ferrireducens]MBI9111665.1 hypothetical protein [Maridesulfovibrio ferrireducens]
MKILSLYIKSIPKCLNWLLGTSVAILLIKIIYLDKLKEPLIGMHKIGIFVEGLLASVIASYVFYIIVVHLKEVRNKLCIYPIIKKWSNGVVGDCTNLLRGFSKHSGIDLTLENISSDNIKNCFLKIDPNSKTAPLLVKTELADWIQFQVFYSNRGQNRIREILTQGLYLDSKLVSLILSIDDCGYFKQIQYIKHERTGNKDISFLTSTFYEYCCLCRTLKEYINKNLKNY